MDMNARNAGVLNVDHADVQESNHLVETVHTLQQSCKW